MEPDVEKFPKGAVLLHANSPKMYFLVHLQKH